jgi:hypothetical protein
MRFSPAFVSNLRAAMSAIARQKYSVPYDWRMVQGSNPNYSAQAADTLSNVPFDIGFARQAAQPTFETIANSPHGTDMRLCIYGQTIDCFALPRANYGTSFWHSEARLGVGTVTLFMRFVDDAGQAVGNPCVMVKATDVTDAEEYLPHATRRNIGPAVVPVALDVQNGGEDRTSEIFDFPRYLRATVSVSSVADDLTSATRIAMFVADQASFDGADHLVTDVLKGPSDSAACSEKMDEVAGLAMLNNKK